MFDLTLSPVDTKCVIDMPDPWSALARRIDPDLAERARGFKLKARRDGHEDLADEVLRAVGRGFIEEFSLERFIPSRNDPHRAFKLQFLGAILDLSREFGMRVSSVVWETLAALGTRDNPHEEQSIVAVKHRLTCDWWLADSILHALGKVFGLHLHVHSRIFAATGCVLDHNCDCDHSAKKVMAGQSVNYLIAPEQFRTATAALLSHILSETLLVAGLKMPFEMGVSPETRLV